MTDVILTVTEDTICVTAPPNSQFDGYAGMRPGTTRAGHTWTFPRTSEAQVRQEVCRCFGTYGRDDSRANYLVHHSHIKTDGRTASVAGVAVVKVDDTAIGGFRMSDSAFPIPDEYGPAVRVSDTVENKKLQVAGYLLVFDVPIDWAEKRSLLALSAEHAYRIASDALKANFNVRNQDAFDRAHSGEFNESVRPAQD